MLALKIVGILIIGICFYIGLFYCGSIVVRDGIEEFKSAFGLGRGDR
jgi:hypothetical protein